MNAVQILYANGAIEQVDRKMNLEEMQAIVGGYIEMVKSNIPHRSLVVNEEGFLEQLPINENASKLVAKGVLTMGGINGNAILVKS